MKVDIFSGFLGAGKTTLIKKMIGEGYQGEKLVLIENEFGEIGIDSGFLKDAGIQITEMNSGCICCSLVGDFGVALQQVIDTYHPDRIIIEPSGVGKLSDVVAAVEKVATDGVHVGATVAVVDATKVKSYMKNFGEFYNNQVQTAKTIVLSRTGNIAVEKLEQAVALLRSLNETATLVTTPWDQLTGQQLLEAMECTNSMEDELLELTREHHCCGHHHDHDHEEHHCCGHHHDHDHEEHHCCGHHHDHDHEEHHCCGHHHDHDHEEHHCCGHHHDHDHEEHHCCGHHHDHDHHHHHADEVFSSWGTETVNTYTRDDLTQILTALDSGAYGAILRAKGMVASEGGWLYFDYVPGEHEIREGTPCVTGKLCVIGAELKEQGIRELFRA